jgi:hypothetical protein
MYFFEPPEKHDNFIAGDFPGRREDPLFMNKIRYWIICSALLAYIGPAVAAADTLDAEGMEIRKEEGPAGHTTIGITEKEESAGEIPRLTFHTLMNWAFSGDDRRNPPESVTAYDKKKVRLIGFMYPLEQGKKIHYFCSLRTTQTCCYGPKPRYNQYVLVEMDAPTRFYRLKPVECEGVFHVEPNPEEGYIYRLEGKTCSSVESR